MMSSTSTKTVPILKSVTLLYSIWIVLWFLAKIIYQDTHWLLWSLNSLAKYLFLPLLLFIPITVFTRNWHVLRLLVIPSVIFGVLYGELFLPTIYAPNKEDGQAVRVMTYNVLNRNAQVDLLADVILAQEADFVGLQELIPANSNRIEPMLASEMYPFHTPLPTEHKLEVGLFSRVPIIESEKLNLPWNDLSLHAVVDFNGAPLHIFVLHLIPTLVKEVPLSEWPSRIVEREAIRMKQIDRFLDALPDSDEPVLVMCDCNFTETTEAYARFEKHLKDSFRDVGWGFGHTIHPVDVNLSLNRIDYIWHSQHFVVKSAKVIKEGNSDHWPVIVDMVLTSK
jgi:endonuclease/exonuclease/phosphatase family metal-dependent hydrolase